MDKEIFFIIEESMDGEYTARALGHSIHTEADDFESLKSNIIDAVRCHFSEIDMPHIIRLHTVKDETVTI